MDSTLLKGLTVLEHLAASDEPRGVSEIARTLQLTKSNAHRTLQTLATAGYVRALPSDTPTRGQRKEYEVLPAGRAELTAWVAEREDPKPVRDPLLLRVRASGVVGPQGLEAELWRHLRLHERQLAEYTGIEERDFPPERNTPEDRLRRLVLRGGIRLETFWIEWLNEALEDVREMSRPGGPGPAA